MAHPMDQRLPQLLHQHADPSSCRMAQPILQPGEGHLGELCPNFPDSVTSADTADTLQTQPTVSRIPTLSPKERTSTNLGFTGLYKLQCSISRNSGKRV